VSRGDFNSRLAGAFYGLKAIPAHWCKKIAMAGKILSMADDPLALATRTAV